MALQSVWTVVLVEDCMTQFDTALVIGCRLIFCPILIALEVESLERSR